MLTISKSFGGLNFQNFKNYVFGLHGCANDTRNICKTHNDKFFGINFPLVESKVRIHVWFLGFTFHTILFFARLISRVCWRSRLGFTIKLTVTITLRLAREVTFMTTDVHADALNRTFVGFHVHADAHDQVSRSRSRSRSRSGSRVQSHSWGLTFMLMLSVKHSLGFTFMLTLTIRSHVHAHDRDRAWARARSHIHQDWRSCWWFQSDFQLTIRQPFISPRIQSPSRPFC